jgi:hypothetical protein
MTYWLLQASAGMSSCPLTTLLGRFCGQLREQQLTNFYGTAARHMGAVPSGRLAVAGLCCTPGGHAALSLEFIKNGCSNTPDRVVLAGLIAPLSTCVVAAMCCPQIV